MTPIRLRKIRANAQALIPPPLSSFRCVAVARSDYANLMQWTLMFDCRPARQLSLQLLQHGSRV